MTFGAMNDNYYQPADDREWDMFVDWCSENDLDPAVEDFDAWLEDQMERAAEEKAERIMDARREDGW